MDEQEFRYWEDVMYYIGRGYTKEAAKRFAMQRIKLMKAEG